MILALGHKVHGPVDGLLLVLRDGHEVVEVALEDRVQVLHDEDVRVDVDHIVVLPALGNELLQEGVPRRPVVQVVVRIPAAATGLEFDSCCGACTRISGSRKIECPNTVGKIQ